MGDTRRVWDLPTRLFHWFLVLSIAASYLTGQGGYDFRAVHMLLGYWLLGLLVFRLVWGFVGPRHARFVEFFPTPGRLAREVTALRRREPVGHVGHGALGGLSVLAMLLALTAQVTSGLFLYDDILYAGPFNASVTEATAKFMNSVHHRAVNVLLALIALHVAAIAYYTLIRKQPLVRAMITGDKPARAVPPDQAIGGSRLGLALGVAAGAAAFVWWLVNVAPP